MSNDNDLEKELLKAKLEIQREIIKNAPKNKIKHSNILPKNKKKKVSTKSLKELRSFESKKDVNKIDIRLIKTPLDVFFYNCEVDILTKNENEVTPYINFLTYFFKKQFKEAKHTIQFLPEGEERSFNEFLVNFFMNPKIAVQILAQQAPKLAKYKDLATFMVMAYVVKNLDLVKKVSQQMLISNSSMELRFLNSIIEYINKDDVIEIIPSIVISLRKFPKSPMLNNAIGYVNLKKGDQLTAKDYFSKAGTFTCAMANLEELDESKNSDGFFCPKMLYLRIKKMVEIGEIDSAREMLKNFLTDHPYKFLSYYIVYGSNEKNDEILSKFSPRAKFYYKTRLLATINLKSMKLIDSYKKALSKKFNIDDQIQVNLDIDTYEFFYQILGGLYCTLFNESKEK